MPDHCMHPPNWAITSREPEHRICCWCDFQQYREYTGDPEHGPNIKAETRRWHWEPVSVGVGGCPGRPENLQRGQVSYASPEA